MNDYITSTMQFLNSTKNNYLVTALLQNYSTLIPQKAVSNMIKVKTSWHPHCLPLLIQNGCWNLSFLGNFSSRLWGTFYNRLCSTHTWSLWYNTTPISSGALLSVTTFGAAPISCSRAIIDLTSIPISIEPLFCLFD